MRKTTLSSNKLFFVCPFCQMEHFIRKKYGNVFFVTAPAGIFSFNEEDFAREIKFFLLRQNITELYLVCDLECNFLNGALSGGTSFGLSCEQVIKSLVSSADNSFSLAEKIIEYQVNRIKNVSGVTDVISSKKIKIYGMVTSKKKNSFVPATE